MPCEEIVNPAWPHLLVCAGHGTLHCRVCDATALLHDVPWSEHGFIDRHRECPRRPFSARVNALMLELVGTIAHRIGAEADRLGADEAFVVVRNSDPAAFRVMDDVVPGDGRVSVGIGDRVRILRSLGDTHEMVARIEGWFHDPAPGPRVLVAMDGKRVLATIPPETLQRYRDAAVAHAHAEARPFLRLVKTPPSPAVN